MAVRSDSRWDLLVENQNGQLTLAVEVKCLTNVSSEWAAQFRGNILAHGIFPNTPYFLMVFLDKFYLWTNANFYLDKREPTYTIDARPILRPYFERAGVTAETISGQSFELIVASWLGEIIYSNQLPENLANSQDWLIKSGLYAAIAGGKIEHEAVA